MPEHEAEHRSAIRARANYMGIASPTDLPKRATLNYNADSAALTSSQTCKQTRLQSEANYTPY